MVQATEETKFTVTKSVRHGMSWADHEDSPGWTARSPPKFSDEMPDITLDEVEYDRQPSAKVDASSGEKTSAAVPRSTTTTVPVYVGGLDYALEAPAIEEFFVSKGIKVSRVRVQKVGGKSVGRAFLNVPDREAFAAILKLDGAKLSNRALTIKEDSGPPPKRPISKQQPNSTWRDNKPIKPTDGKWHSVASGGKVVDAPREPKPQKPAVVTAAPVAESSTTSGERKKLELKPRSKPVEEGEAAVSSNQQRSSIFGNAKPRDEFAYQERKKVLTGEASEAAIVTKDEQPEPKQKEPVVEAPVVVEPVFVAPVIVKQPAPQVKKVSAPKNRFAVGFDNDSSEDEE